MISNFSTQAVASDTQIYDVRQRRNILIAICLALIAVVASVSGLNVAQLPIATDLRASQSEVLWMINVYAITLAALLLPLGAVGDRWGRKPILLVGLALFAVANAAAGFAATIEIMLGARFLSGVGAAMIMPVTLSVITSVFPDGERSKAIGVWTAVAGSGGLLGMFLSALLVDALNWRYLFLLPVVLVAVSAVMATRFIPNLREQSEHRFDFVGAILSLVAISALIYFLTEGPQQGWDMPVTLVSLAVAVGAGTGFAVWELRYKAPLIDIRMFRQRSLTSGSLSLLTWFGVQAGVLVVLYPYFQAVLGWSGLLTTLGLMPIALSMMAFSLVAPRMLARVGTRVIMAAGIAIGAIGIALMAGLVSVDGGYLSVLPGMIALGVGMGLSMAPSTEAITSSLPRDQQGVASALNDVTRELGASLGVALLGGVFVVGYSRAIASRVGGLPVEAAQSAGRGIADALAIASQGKPYSHALYRAAQEAFVLGWQQSMWAGVVAMTVLFAFVLARGPESAPLHAERTSDDV